MKSILLPFLFAVIFTLRAVAAEALPPEIVGEWKSQDERAVLVLRSDGLCAIGAQVGAAGIATYDPNSHLLTVSIRHDRTGEEVTKVTLIYDPKAQTITPRKQGTKLAIYKRHSKDLPEPFKSLDLNKVLHPKQSP